jgi:tRNA(Arg) A34 adenosine deaminase TadA
MYNLTAFAYDKKGTLLSIGRNSYVKTHPLQAELAKKAGVPNKVYLHAEIDAILRARRKNIHKLVIVRHRADGSTGRAEPCPICRLAIRRFNIQIVEHT